MLSLNAYFGCMKNWKVENIILFWGYKNNVNNMQTESQKLIICDVSVQWIAKHKYPIKL